MDGAHNPSGARALANYIRSHHGRRKKILVFGVMKDKDYPAILREILPLFDRVIMTRPDMERALSPHRLGEYAKGAIIKESMRDALAEARDLAGDEDLVVITGSIFAIGEAKAVIGDIF
jgi:dihydrofolate synthase/folylpolyglutamate synthase